MSTNLLPKLGRTVGVMAHPDDLFYVAAGVMAYARSLGHHVTAVSATSGDLGSLDHKRWPPHLMTEVREQEEIDANALIGVKDIRFLRFPDGRLHLIPFEIGVAAVLAILMEVRPQTVITYGPDGLTGHSDHKVISAWTTEAFRRAGLPAARLLYVAVTAAWVEKIAPVLARAGAIYEMPPATPTAMLALDYALPREVLALKLRGVNAHDSQSRPLAEAIGGLSLLQPWFAHERFRAA